MVSGYSAQHRGPSIDLGPARWEYVVGSPTQEMDVVILLVNGMMRDISWWGCGWKIRVLCACTQRVYVCSVALGKVVDCHRTESTGKEDACVTGYRIIAADDGSCE